MANMTPQSNDSPNDGKKDGAKGEDGVGMVARATENAAALAGDGIQRTRARMDEQISKQREQLTGKLRTLGRALRGAGEMLEEDNVVAHGLHFTSEKVTRVADYVAELNPTTVVEDLRDVARRQPVWFFGGAFGLGLLLARFAKSSASGSEPSTEHSMTRSSRALETRTETARRSDESKEPGKRRSSGNAEASGTRTTSTPRSSGSPA